MVHFRVILIQKEPNLLHTHPFVSESKTKFMSMVLVILFADCEYLLWDVNRSNLRVSKHLLFSVH